MKICLILILSLLLGGCSLRPIKSEIEIVTSPVAKIIIDDKEMGTTASTYKNDSLKPEEINLKLVPENENLVAWSGKVKLNNLVATVVSRNFGVEEKYASGYVMYMEEIGKKEEPALIVNSKPAEAAVAIDGQIKGLTPNKIEKVVEGDRGLVVSFPGYESQTIFVKMRKGYQVVMDVQLALKKYEETDDVNEEDLPMAEVKKVEIKETGTGWLRARSEPSLSGVEVAKVDVGKQYELLDKNEADWYEIKIDEETNGWISAEYALIVEVGEPKIEETGQ